MQMKLGKKDVSSIVTDADTAHCRTSIALPPLPTAIMLFTSQVGDFV